MAKKTKKNKSFSFKNIFKTTLYFHLSDSIISLIIFLIVLLAILGFYLRKTELDKENNDLNVNNFYKYLGTTMLIIFGTLSVLLLIPIILNFFTFFMVDYVLEEAFE
jgi:hypothetical protein